MRSSTETVSRSAETPQNTGERRLATANNMADTAIETLREEIKEFLKGADLSSASSKIVRAHLNEKFDCDFSSRKHEIDKVVMEVLTELEGDDRKDSEDEDDDPEDDSGDNYSDEEKPKKRKPSPRKPPPKKKRSKASDSDEESEEPSDDDDDSEDDRKKKKKRASNGNSVKGGNNVSKRGQAAARKSGGADGGGGGGGKPRATGYLKKLKLSPELSEVMGEELMARNEVVKKMYAVVKERGLLDPKNRQYALLDEQLQNVFGQKRVRMFGMLKLLGKHFSAAD